MEAQSRLIDALDTKAAVLLAVDGVLAGLLFDHGADAAPAPRLLLTVMFLSLFSSFVLALASFWVRQYATAPVLGSVVRFMERDREWLKWRSLGNLQQAYQANERKPQRKARPIAWVSLPLPDEGQQRRVSPDSDFVRIAGQRLCHRRVCSLARQGWSGAGRCGVDRGGGVLTGAGISGPTCTSVMSSPL